MTNLGNKNVFAKNLKKYMQLNGKTRNEVCQALGLKYTTFADWVNGKKYPRMDKIEMLANYFGIKKSDLIEDNDSFLIELVEDSNTKKQKGLPPFGRSPCCSCINEKEQIMLVTITE